MPEGFIRKGDDHAPLTGSQCIEGEEELVFPEFAQPRWENGIVVVNAIDSEEITWQVSPGEDFDGVGVLNISIGHSGEAPSKRLPCGLLSGLEEVLSLEDNFITLD